LKYNVICGRRIHYIHSLHEKYGHVVRTGPEEVDFSDFQSFKEIHRIGGRFLKSPWYQKFRDAPVLATFSMLDPKQHAARRKLLARPFSNTSLRENWEQVVCQKFVCCC
jgi:cytochrome P450